MIFNALSVWAESANIRAATPWAKRYFGTVTTTMGANVARNDVDLESQNIAATESTNEDHGQ